eukprot:93570-Chlamydomonas_euryale.AAC.1
MPSGSAHSGAAIRIAVRNCDDTAPLRLTVPAGSPAAVIATGGQPVPIVHLASTPSSTRPSTRSWKTGRGRGGGSRQG